MIENILMVAYAVMALYMGPAFWRLIRNKSHKFDAVKACCALLAVSNFLDYGSLTDSWRVVSATITQVIFVMLLVVIFKTEKAMSGGGES